MAARKRKKRKAKKESVLVIGLILLLGFLLFGSKAMEIVDLHNQKQALKAQIQTATEESEQLDEEVAQIGSKNYIEMIARKYLGLFYPGEQIVVPIEGESDQEGTDAAKEKNENKKSTTEATPEQTPENTAEDGTSNQ